jgi:nitrite reductase (NADH) large subunit
VVEVDRVRRVVRAEDGTEEEYDRLLMCTGSNPFILPCRQRPAGRDRLPRHRRHQRDDRGQPETQARVVIGGGLLGLEAANGLMLRGMDVTVVHVMPWLMERQLDDVAASCCRSRWKTAA